VTLFFGGPAGPIFFGLTWFWPTIWFMSKVMVFLFIFVWFRATLPRLRYDQLMDLGWKVLIPLSLFWLMFISLKELRVSNDWNWVATYGAAAGGLLLGGTLLITALRAGDRAYQKDSEDA